MSYRQRSYLMPWYGARVTVTNGTNNTLEFGNGAGNHDLVLGHESGLRVPVCTLFLLVLRQSTALYSLLSSCFKIASDGEKWSNYVHNHISDTQGVKTTPFCAGTLVLVLVPQVKPPVYRRKLFCHISF